MTPPTRGETIDVDLRDDTTPQLRGPALRGRSGPSVPWTSSILRPLAVFAASRIVVLAAMETVRRLRPSPMLSLSQLSAQWDGAWYLHVVRHGYADHLDIDPVTGDALASNHVFFPLYPMVVRVTNVIVPGGDIRAGVFVTLVATAIGVVLLREVARRLTGAEAADRAVLLFCFFPGTLALSWTYADGLMVALIAGSMLFLTDRRWLLAAFVAAFATATRPNVLPLALACAWVAWEEGGPALRRWARSAVAAVVASAGFIAFHVYLAIRTGETLAWFKVERDAWDEGRPFNRLWHVIKTYPDSGSGFMRIATLLFVAIAITGLVLTLRSALPRWAKAMTVVALILAVSTNTAPTLRQQLVALPMFIAAGARLRGVTLGVTVGAFGAGLILAAFVYLYPSSLFGWAA
jgi:hypothetical protein